MQVLDFTEKATTKNTGRNMANDINHILDSKVVIGGESDPENIKFSWDVVAMEYRKLEL